MVFCLASLSFAVLRHNYCKHAKDSATADADAFYLDGEAIAASQIIVKDGVSYMDTALPSLWRSVRWCNRGERGLLIISPPKPSIEGEKAIAEGQHFSEQFRKAVSGVAD